MRVKPVKRLLGAMVSAWLYFYCRIFLIYLLRHAPDASLRHGKPLRPGRLDAPKPERHDPVGPHAGSKSTCSSSFSTRRFSTTSTSLSTGTIVTSPSVR